MSGKAVLVLATLETKTSETEYLVDCLTAQGVDARVIDISLASDGVVLDSTAKLAAMEATVAAVSGQIADALAEDVRAVIGLGGGTGGEIALNILRGLPVTFPKVLITTLPFDPRIAVADSSIILVPTLADICGLNATLRAVLENAAALTAGLCATFRKPDASVSKRSVGITGLGATEAAVSALVSRFAMGGREATVFHANGYGGAAFARLAGRGAFDAIIDLTPHEVTRIHIAGAHVSMPDRFSAGGDLPRILLPGAVNFLGLGAKSTLPSAYLERPHYQHSGYFTHAKVTPDEMATVAEILVGALNDAQGPRALIVPMGGFSHQDRPGGAIEDPELRAIFFEVAREGLDAQVTLDVIDAHISLRLR